MKTKKVLKSVLKISVVTFVMALTALVLSILAYSNTKSANKADNADKAEEISSTPVCEESNETVLVRFFHFNPRRGANEISTFELKRDTLNFIKTDTLASDDRSFTHSELLKRGELDASRRKVEYHISTYVSSLGDVAYINVNEIGVKDNTTNTYVQTVDLGMMLGEYDYKKVSVYLNSIDRLKKCRFTVSRYGISVRYKNRFMQEDSFQHGKSRF